MKYIMIMLISSFLISSCSLSSIAESKYPDRSKFSFKDDFTEGTNVYLCEKLATDELTAQRAKIAHQYISAQIKRITSEMMTGILEEKEFSIFSAMGSSVDMNKKTKKMAEVAEEKYGCLLIDSID